MDNLDKELQRLSKINPAERFIKASKERLMHKIQQDPQINWFQAFFKKTALLEPSVSFITQARSRLMAQISELPQPMILPLRGLAYVLNFLKKAVASTLVMVIAVTAVLFQLEGNTIVEASDDSYVEVTSGTILVKHGEPETWEEVRNQIQVQAGDLIQVKDSSEAVVHFFDDTQVRLNKNTTLLIDQLDFSPTFSDQGIIETSLQEGEAWVQTLNVEDGYASFTMHTQGGILNTLNAAFTVRSVDENPTELAVFNGTVGVSSFSPINGQLTQKTYLSADKMLTLAVDEMDNPVFTETGGFSAIMEEGWIQENLKKDQEHLTTLREKEYDRLTLMAGTLPGDLLYPIKQAKELLKLEWSGNTDLSVKIEIANNRLNEAIILFERGENAMAQNALKAYQDLTREILAINKANKDQKSEPLITQLVVPHQKILSNQPNDKNSIKVKEALQKTAEILAQNPLELENVRLNNSVANLKDILVLIEGGELELAKEKMSKYKISEVQVDLLSKLEEPVKREAYESILSLRQEERDLLALVSEKTNTLEKGNEELVAMVESASKEADLKTEEIRLAALPLMPELIDIDEVAVADPNESDIIDKAQIAVEVSEAKALADRINIYTAWEGQLNQINRLLGEALEDTSKIDFLLEVQKHLTGRANNYLATRILQLRNKFALELEKEEELPVQHISPVLPSDSESEITEPTDPTEIEIEENVEPQNDLESEVESNGGDTRLKLDSKSL